MTSPLDVLLRRSGHRGLSWGVLLGLALSALITSCCLMYGPLDQRAEIHPGPYTLWLVVGVTVAFCCAWDNRVLHLLRQEVTATPSHVWSDGLLWRGARTVIPLCCGVVLMGLLHPAVAPGDPLETLLWLPVCVCLLVSLAYTHQLWAVMPRSCRGWGVSVAALGLVPLAAWAVAAHRDTLLTLALSSGLLLVVRRWLIHRLDQPVQAELRSFATAVQRPRSRHPILMLEAWRAMHRRRGGVAMRVRRYGLLVAVCSVVVVSASPDVVDNGWPMILSIALWSLLAGVSSYTSVVSAVQDEQTAVLVQCSALRTREFVQGYVTWATQLRYLEASLLLAVAGGVVWERWPRDLGCALVVLGCILGAGLLTSAAAARLGLVALRLPRGGWVAHRYLLKCLLPATLISVAVPWLLVAQFLYSGGGSLEFAAIFTLPLAISLGLFILANRVLRRHFDFVNNAL